MINSNKIDVIVLAAGKGSRMKSRTPKVLHKIIKKMINLIYTVQISTIQLKLF